MSRGRTIESFDFQPGRVLASKYAVEGFVGSGWEGEVYRVRELTTDVPRAIKVFYPQRNQRDGAVRRYARKLERLRKCPIVIQYHHLESIQCRGMPVTCLVSEFVEGELLESFVASQPGKRLHPFEALHLTYALAAGVEEIHHRRDYHGDLHDRNVLVKRRGIGFELKIVDFYHWGRPDGTKIKEDVIQLVRILYDAVGGRARYASQPPQVKSVCCGLRHDLICQKFPTAGHLRSYLESFSWNGHR